MNEPKMLTYTGTLDFSNAGQHMTCPPKLSPETELQRGFFRATVLETNNDSIIQPSRPLEFDKEETHHA